MLTTRCWLIPREKCGSYLVVGRAGRREKLALEFTEAANHDLLPRNPAIGQLARQMEMSDAARAFTEDQIIGGCANSRLE